TTLHCEILHRRRNANGKRRGSRSTADRQLRRQRAITRLGLACALRQRCHVARFFELSQASLCVGKKLRQRLWTHMVAPCRVMDGRDALLDPCELTRIDIELLPVPAQSPCALIELNARRLEKRDRLVQRGVMRGGVSQSRDQRRHATDERVVAFRKFVLT